MTEPLEVCDRADCSKAVEVGSQPAAPRLRKLYDEVVAHYHRCQARELPLSDTWIQTLKHRGRLYTFDDMLNMLSPSNKVNFWIDDLHYLIDSTALDLQDPIVRRLLEGGEPDVGGPRKDLPINGRRCASNFIHHDVVGNVYFFAYRYAKARQQYQHSVAIKPYLRHIQAKALYCALPDDVREAGLFGAPSDLALVFQRKQDFYHGVGLSNK